MDGKECFSSNADAVLNAGRSKTWSMLGRRKESVACGRGRIDVASAEAVMLLGRRNAARLSQSRSEMLRVEKCDEFDTEAARELQRRNKDGSAGEL